MRKISFQAILLGWMAISCLVPAEGYTREILDSPDMVLGDEDLGGGDPAIKTAAQEKSFDDRSAPPLEVLNSILASPDFGGEQEGWGIGFKGSKEPEQIAPLDFDPASWVERIKVVFALGLRIILIIAIGGIGVFSILSFFKRHHGKGNPLQNPGSRRPDPSLQESPESFLTHSRALHAQGRIREAWAACLAASLAALSQYKGLQIPLGATEYDCLALVRGTLPEDADGFAGLLKHWIPCAYSGKSPEDGAFQASLRFCESLLDGRNHA